MRKCRWNTQMGGGSQRENVDGIIKWEVVPKWANVDEYSNGS